MLKTLFLNPPSFDGFDGGSGARYQARHEVRSFWYPIWRWRSPPRSFREAASWAPRRAVCRSIL